VHPLPCKIEIGLYISLAFPMLILLYIAIAEKNIYKSKKLLYSSKKFSPIASVVGYLKRL